jgi:hypothetical protein
MVTEVEKSGLCFSYSSKKKLMGQKNNLTKFGPAYIVRGTAHIIRYTPNVGTGTYGSFHTDY